MKLLSLETSAKCASCAVTDNGRVLASAFVNTAQTHSQTLMPMVTETLSVAGISVAQLDGIAVAAGPGSFTGVRIGVATAKAMAQAAQKPCIAVSTLEALAYSSRYFDGIIAPILDARRNQVYNALFDCKKGNATRMTRDRALALSELLEELKELNRDVIFMGDGTLVFENEIREALGERAFFAPKTTRMNLAGAVAELGLEKFKAGETVAYGELVPEYVRLSQAEQDRLKKLGSEL